MTAIRDRIAPIRGALDRLSGARSGESLHLVCWLLAVALCTAYVFTALEKTAGAPFAGPDSLHNAILARNLAEHGSYHVQVVQYHAGATEVEHIPEMHGLLQPLLLAAAFAAFGADIELNRVPGILFAAALGLVTFAFARQRFGPVSALAACALVLQSGELFKWAWIGTDDVGFAFLYFASIALAVRALDGGSRSDWVWAGVVAGVATLQKPEGILFPVVFGAVALASPGVPIGRIARRWALLAGPALLGIAAYVIRNILGHGSPSFRWGAIDWLYKSQGLPAYFRIYDEVPGVVEVMQTLGASEVARIIGFQLLAFLESLIPPLPLKVNTPPLVEPGVVTVLALLALPLLWRRQRAFVLFVSATIAASSAFMCMVWHYEPRFFLMLLPLLSVAFAGLLEAGLGAARRGAAGAAVSLLCVVTVAGLVASAARSMPGEPPPERTVFDQCRDAMTWISSSTDERDRILSFDPWAVTWMTGRPAIVIPSGGRAAVERIVERYEPRWLLMHVRPRRGPDIQLVREMITRRTTAFSLTPAFHGARCSVFEIGGPRVPRPAVEPETDPSRSGESGESGAL